MVLLLCRKAVGVFFSSCQLCYLVISFHLQIRMSQFLTWQIYGLINRVNIFCTIYFLLFLSILLNNAEYLRACNNAIILKFDSWIAWCHILISTFIIKIPAHCLVGRVFANGPGDLGSIPGCVIPKTFKIILDTSLLNTQQYKIRIKGKVEQSKERSSILPHISV